MLKDQPLKKLEFILTHEIKVIDCFKIAFSENIVYSVHKLDRLLRKLARRVLNKESVVISGLLQASTFVKHEFQTVF